MAHKKQIILLGTIFLLLCYHLQCFGQADKPEVPVFDSHKAFQLLVKQCDFGPRNPGSQGYKRCLDYLVKTLTALADKVEIQTFPFTFGNPEQTVTASNLIARFSPQKSDRILLCTHWDTRPWADADPDPRNHKRPIIGANDGASGVAVLLEVARLLHAHKSQVGVDIVLFDAEDAGISGDTWSWAQGSAYFAKNLSARNRPRFGILIDMIGDADLVIYQEANSRAYAKSVVDLVWKTAAELKLDAFKPEAGPSMMDDHIPLLQVGIPCIDLIDFEYPHWHTLEDTPDKCSEDSLGQVGRLLVQVIYGLKQNQ
ncbi:MAG: DUF4910 domain-containing protein [Candidatus Aminicenantes bacterium]|nr:DUF4910 domain-containing protein [Candidatus Aminicenantes bacterium]